LVIPGGSGNGRLVAIVLLAAFLGLPAVLGQGARVRVLYVGDPYPGKTPYIYMKVEPMLQVTPIQASRDYLWGLISGSEIKRAMRLYMPRSYRSMIEMYHVVIISDANVGSFTDEQLRWVRTGVSEDGLGMAMMGGHETFGTNGHHPDWGATPVGDNLPVETMYGGYESGRLRILDEQNEFMSSLPWRPDLPFLRNYPSNMVKLKNGAELLARTTVTPDMVYDRKYLNWQNPFFSTWIYNSSGRVFAMTGDWTPGGGAIFMEWDYIQDFATNLMLYCNQSEIPKDLNLVHSVRTRMTEMAYRRMLITSLIDFVERFGADSTKVLEAAEVADEAGDRSRGLYLEQDFASALEEVNEAIELLAEAEELAENVKNSALLWIYVSEWLVVTSSGLLCGFVIWSLMVKRKLYRTVKTTRLGR
jgi:uncharacterized membrane protein